MPFIVLFLGPRSQWKSATRRLRQQAAIDGVASGNMKPMKRTYWIVLVGLTCLVPTVAAAAGLTLVADPRAVQWSTQCVTATLISQGGPKAVTADGSIGACINEFRIRSVIDGKIAADTIVRTMTLVRMPGGQPDPDLKIGSDYVLLLMPLSGASIALPAGTELRLPRGIMVAIYEVAEHDLQAERRQELDRVIRETRATDATVNPDLVRGAVAAFTNPHDDTERDQSEKLIYEIGPRAVPELERQLSARPAPSGAAESRIRQAITDLSPPPLRVQDANANP
jgi:hypothetical protein